MYVDKLINFKGEIFMPIEAGDFRTGLTLLIDGQVYQVLDFQHVKPGKGAAILKTKLKNIKNGNILERNFNASTKFDQAIVEKKEIQYSYKADEVYYFMDMETFDTYEITEDMIGFAKNFLLEGSMVKVKFYEGEVIGLEIDEKIALEVTETSDAVPGNTASNATKDAIVETGFLVRVPLFIKLGDKIIVNTNDGKYCGRA